MLRNNLLAVMKAAIEIHLPKHEHLPGRHQHVIPTEKDAVRILRPPGQRKAQRRGPGFLRELLGSYTVPFVTAGFVCLLAAIVALRIRSSKAAAVVTAV